MEKRFMEQNRWRALKVDALMCALTAVYESGDSAQAQVERAISGLLIPASKPAEYGFRVEDYRWYAQRYQARIDGYNHYDGSRRYGLQETVIHKTNIVGRINARLQRTHGPAVKTLIEKRKNILADISDIKARIEIYKQVINHLNTLAEKFSKRERVLVQPVTKTAVKA